MLKCWTIQDNNCTKVCNGKIKECPLAAFLNGERKTRPNRKVMEKFVAEYKPPVNKQRKERSINRVADKVSVAISKTSGDADVNGKTLSIAEGVDKIMRIVYGDDYDKHESKV